MNVPSTIPAPAPVDSIEEAVKELCEEPDPIADLYDRVTFMEHRIDAMTHEMEDLLDKVARR